jgi:hypothetical protein
MDPIHNLTPCLFRMNFNVIPLLHLCLQNGLFCLGYPTKIVHTFFISCARYIPRPSHAPWFYHPKNVWWGVKKLWNYSLCSLIQPPFTSSLLGPKIILPILYKWIILAIGFIFHLVHNLPCFLCPIKTMVKVKVKLSLCFNTTLWRRIGEWRYSSMHSSLQH